jgi:RNA polymerase sigma-70 factor, ECF subfamily
MSCSFRRQSLHRLVGRSLDDDVGEQPSEVDRAAHGLGERAQHQFAASCVHSRGHRFDGQKTSAADVVHAAKIDRDPDGTGIDGVDQPLGEVGGRTGGQSAGDCEDDHLAAPFALDRQSPAAGLRLHRWPSEYSSRTGSAVSASQDSDDLLIVDRCLAGDTAAFEILVVRYQTLAFNVALRMLGDRADAADATQSTFVKIFAKLQTYDRQRRFFSWMYRILSNECLSLLRTRQRRESAPLAPETPALDPHEILEAAEREAVVRAGLLALTPLLREAIVLRYFGGLSYQEMGVALDLPEKTVKSRLHTARQRLYQHFRERGVFRSGDRYDP